MIAIVRATLGLVLVGAGVGAALWLGSGEAAETGGDPGGQGGAKSQWLSSVQCKDCHADVWAEWHGSHHQIAYLNPEVRALSEDFRNKDCQACHLPVPISMTGYGTRTLPRQTFPDEGVSCLTCHLGKAGEILGRNSVPEAPCKPVANTDVISMGLCESCHNQHQTTDQWRASPQAAAGTSCNDCHMPEVERRLGDGSTRKGRAHRYPGAHDAAMLRTSAKFDVTVVAAEGGGGGREIELRLENVGAGHNFPTEERHRAVDMVLRFVDGEGKASEWITGYRFRQPYRDEKGDNTQLPAGEAKAVRIAVPEGAVRAEARLWYRLTPYVEDSDPKCTLLEERSVDLR